MIYKNYKLQKWDTNDYDFYSLSVNFAYWPPFIRLLLAQLATQLAVRTEGSF